MRKVLPILALFTAIASADAQQVGQNKPADGSENFTLSVKVQLVVEAVVVKDKDGKPIQGLAAKDFALTEDGVPQTVRIWRSSYRPRHEAAKRSSSTRS